MNDSGPAIKTESEEEEEPKVMPASTSAQMDQERYLEIEQSGHRAAQERETKLQAQEAEKHAVETQRGLQKRNDDIKSISDQICDLQRHLKEMKS